jgi:hypothetical protein
MGTSINREAQGARHWSWRLEARSQKSEVGGQRTEDTFEFRNPNFEFKRQESGAIASRWRFEVGGLRQQA